MDKVKQYIPFITAILIIITFILLGFKGCRINRMEDRINLLEGINDSLTSTRNPDGTLTSQIYLLQANNAALLLNIVSKDETIRELQAEVKKNKDKIKNGGSVTVLNSITDYNSTVETSILPVIDGDSCNMVYEAGSKDTTWIDWKIRASKDSTHLDLRVKNKYSIVIGSEKIGLFKRKPIVEVTNYNPYTDTKSLRAFEIKDNTSKNRISLGIQMGYGLTLRGLSPYVGLGLNFKII